MKTFPFLLTLSVYFLAENVNYYTISVPESQIDFQHNFFPVSDSRKWQDALIKIGIQQMGSEICSPYLKINITSDYIQSEPRIGSTTKII